MKLDVIKTIEKTRFKINRRYAYYLEDAIAIFKYSKGDIWKLIYSFFVLGYAQGIKAYKAEIKKKTKPVQ